MTTREIIESLPEQTREVVDVIGLEATITLSRKAPLCIKGFCRIYVPKRYRQGHWINKAIGEEAFRKLQKIFGGDHIFPVRIIEEKPKKYARRFKRNKNIVNDYCKGLTLDQLAVKHKLHRRMISYIVKSEVKQSNMLKLRRNTINKIIR